MRKYDLDLFTRSYLETVLWAETDDEGEPLEKDYTIEDFAPKSIEKARQDCQRFQDDNADDLAQENAYRGAARREYSTLDLAAHDLWLTKCGHGCGFWDGDWREDIGKRLTAYAKGMGEQWVYVGDDGLIYLS